MRNMKIALVHDRLCILGGAERVFQYICQTFPDADIYTLAYDRSTALPYFSSRRVHTTWLDPFVRSPLAFKLAFPVATHVMEAQRLSGYDLVLTSSATVAKYVGVVGGTHVCYCYMPTRAIWHADAYFDRTSIKARVFFWLRQHLQRRDYSASQRVNHFITISEMSRAFIRQYYDRDSEVIPCPIDLSLFYSAPKQDHYLLVSRLEHWKRVDYAIEAFNRLGLPLRVIGTGEEEKRLRAMAKPNVTFLGAVDDQALAREYSQARAVIFTPYLEYGLIPLEANASGTPVICFGKGGVNETMIPVGAPGDGRTAPPTAVFFDEQTPESLVDAVRRFESYTFDPAALVQHASQWSVPVFQERIRRSAFAAVSARQGSNGTRDGVRPHAPASRLQRTQVRVDHQAR
jgi:glycosyltransferase involved in cell wall biosynthesis